ncbi:zinc finger protein ZAT5-like [Prosopis cineraria]|uniref:zinc finger protein ZAT5-like n=1 Tax=Prosopis cineraria TaxID=364024 RepID=UPI00240FBC8D|nr:zinc finger protein ZAT5-like [Prosopis cineraria]
MEVTGQEIVVWNKDQAQVMKGKRTKRSRLPSPIRLSVASSSSSAGRTSTEDNSGGSSSVVDMATASTDQLRVSTEEEDMANCLILLAQGHTPEPSCHINNNNNDKASSGLYLYQCKTCDRCFPSFQALGGHRASHKKPKPNNNSEEKLPSVTFAKEDGHDPYGPTTDFVLSLQISNRASHSGGSNTNKSKVHECSICGAEFTSGQALGGHMRRHRTLVNNSATCTTTSTGNNSELQEANKPKNVLKLDLNLPAPEDDHREAKLTFQSKENVLVFSASSLVDCHY